MNVVAQEIMSYFGTAKDESLEHIGMPRRSGRYPWGSGKYPYQRTPDLLSRIETLKKSGWTETPENIWNEFGLTTGDYRIQKANVQNERDILELKTIKSMRDDGLGYTEIGRRLGISESSVRSKLDAKHEFNMMQATNTANFIREQITNKGPVDLGTGVERELKISKEKLNQAIEILESEGYEIRGGRVDQATNPGQKTTLRVLFPPGAPKNALYEALENDNIHSLHEYVSRDDGKSYEKKFTYPASMDSKRLQIRYADDAGPDGHSGKEKDGIIELRRGVEDLSLGESRYSQVRILVDNDRYLKGMAVYSDDMPDGIDVIFNTNKTSDVPMNKVLKEIKSDPDNPFGSLIKDADQGGQYWYGPENDRKLGLINKRADEGDWTEWKDALPSQFLAKQSKAMAEKQLNLAIVDKVAEFDEYNSLTNPTIKKHLLAKFADECDSAAVHLQAAALPGQKYHVIIPVNALKDNEVYAPGYEAGTKLALIRYPHGGIFEIPILTVNNKQPLARKIIGTESIDAIGINSKIAEQLSGADFDGDTVMCIPTHDKGGKVKIINKEPLEGLKNADGSWFDPKMEYGTIEKADGYYSPDGRKISVMKNTGTQMGIVSNLITDMTLKGADWDEISSAVKHSMVVIDAEKHKLDYKKSEIDNNISLLKKKYQSYVDEDGKQHNGGASTLISRSKGEKTVDKRQGSPSVDPETGKQIWKTADDLYYPVRSYDKENGLMVLQTTDKKKVSYKVDDAEATEYYKPIQKTDPKTGATIFTNKDGSISYKVATRTQKSTQMAETDDAYSLISDWDTPMERAYADYANKMKSLANEARKEVMNTGKVSYSSTAKETYRAEFDSLMQKLNEAELNRPRERMAQIKTYAEVGSKKKAYEAETGTEMKPKEVKKLNQQGITKYRDEVGNVSRKDRSIVITDREWEAIQAGAISETNLKKILNNTDVDALRQRATPRATSTLSVAQVNKIQAMSQSNYTLEQIAEACNVSKSSVSKYLKGGT